jgi:hypothetical protein
VGTTRLTQDRIDNSNGSTTTLSVAVVEGAPAAPGTYPPQSFGCSPDRGDCLEFEDSAGNVFLHFTVGKKANSFVERMEGFGRGGALRIDAARGHTFGFVSESDRMLSSNLILGAIVTLCGFVVGRLISLGRLDPESEHPSNQQHQQ